MPVTEPNTEAVNLTPTSVEFESPLSIVVGVEKSKMVSSGTTSLDGLEALPSPAMLDAATVNV